MDKWLAAVAAGASSVAHHFKKLKQPSEQISSHSSNHGSVSHKLNSPKPPSDKKWKKWPFSKSSKNEGDLVNEVSARRSKVSFRRRIINRRAFRSLTSLESCAKVHVEPTIETCNVHNSSVVKNESESLDATLLVCLGMSFGMLYSCVESKREVERLNRLVKQKESLIQDLEEEIEMKGSLIMQELTVDDHESQKTESRDSFSEIEAELEAELEMLELGMTSSCLETKISNLVELDADFESGVTESESRGEMVDTTNEENEATYSGNYAVCPRELSLRLHEVIQSRLEERIRELEAQIEVQNWKSLNDFSGYESYEDEPIILNRSVEACSECAKFDEIFDYDDDNGTPPFDGIGGDERDIDDDDDEMEKLLIKHLVEKATQGSPAVLNAQRALFSEYSLESRKFRY